MNNEISLDYAEKKIRFMNFLIDKFFLWILWIVNLFLFQDTIDSILGDNSGLMNILYVIGFYLLYYIFLESIFGRTIGKFITGTKVIGFDEKKPTFGRIVIRSLCRIIPLDAVSFLFSEDGWHDSISKTYVINV